MSGLKAAVLVFPGSNGDRDLHETFERAGFESQTIRADAPLPGDIAVVGLPGGFSYGDYWRAGMLASQARGVRDLRGFVNDGGLAIGICNGFQILVEGGLLPGGVHYNDPPGFRHTWLTLKVSNAAVNASPWFFGIAPGTELRMPMAHGEGNYFHPDGAAAIEQWTPLTYIENPNGSMGDIAGLLDPTGRILGIMPHPERASDVHLGSADGLALFTAARSWLENPVRSEPAKRVEG